MASESAGLRVDKQEFMMAFGRDVDFHDNHPQMTYFDRRTGNVLWLCEKDEDAPFELGIDAEDNHRDRERVDADSDRYLGDPRPRPRRASQYSQAVPELVVD